MLNIIRKQNQNLNEIPPQTHQDGYYQNKKKQKINVGKDAEKLEPLCLVAGNVKWNGCYGK